MARRLTRKAYCANCVSVDVPADYVAGSPFVCAECGEKNNTWHGSNRATYRALMNWCLAEEGRTWCIAGYTVNGNNDSSVLILAMSAWVTQTALLHGSGEEADRTTLNALELWRHKHLDALRRSGKNPPEEAPVIYEFVVTDD